MTELIPTIPTNVLIELIHANSTTHFIEKTSLCGLMLLASWSSSKIPKLLLTGICLRKLYKVYTQHKSRIDQILDDAF